MQRYPKIYNLGHAAIKDLLQGQVIVEEKVDGSQFSFGIDRNGTLIFRSKEASIEPEAPPKMFAKGVEAVKAIADKLTPGLIYRGEYLEKPKHNALAYDRIPNGHIIIFDINDGLESYLSYGEKRIEAARLGFEVVPILLEGALTSYDAFTALLETTSILGGQKVEGVVIKNYSRFCTDGTAMMGKFVSEHFREIHGGEWKKANPSKGDIITGIIHDLKTPARWDKAIQHLRERGILQNDVKDIGPLFREVPEDAKAECLEMIKDRLVKWAWPQIQRGITAGLAEYYKEKLAQAQFGGENEAH